MAEMRISVSYEDLVAEITYEGGWNPDVADDMVKRCGEAFRQAVDSTRDLLEARAVADVLDEEESGE